MRVQNIFNFKIKKRLGYMTPEEKYNLLINNKFYAIAF